MKLLKKVNCKINSSHALIDGETGRYKFMFLRKDIFHTKHLCLRGFLDMMCRKGKIFSCYIEGIQI